MPEKKFFKRKSSVLTILLFAVLLFSALLPAEFVSGSSPSKTDALNSSLSPGQGHFFGTDHLGRDVFARVLDASRIDLSIAAVSTVFAFLLGTALGAISGFAGGAVDFIITRILEIFQSIPGILLGLLVMVLAGSGYQSLVVVITLINIPIYARLTRSEVQPIARSPVVSAARLSMVSRPRTLLVYVLPSALTSTISYIPVQAGFSISVAAGFGFIGLGISPPQAEWGMMIKEGLSGLLFLKIWWPVVFPSLYLIVSVLALYRLGYLVSRRFA